MLKRPIISKRAFIIHNIIGNVVCVATEKSTFRTVICVATESSAFRNIVHVAIGSTFRYVVCMETESTFRYVVCVATGSSTFRNVVCVATESTFRNVVCMVNVANKYKMSTRPVKFGEKDIRWKLCKRIKFDHNYKMVNAQTRFCPTKWYAKKSLGFWNKKSHLIPVEIPYRVIIEMKKEELAILWIRLFQRTTRQKWKEAKR